jgi:hypothetical protein
MSNLSRKEIFSAIKTIREAEEAPTEEAVTRIENSIPSLLESVSTKWVTLDMVKKGHTIAGFLYNVGAKNYVGSKDDLLNANKDKISDGAILFYLKYDKSKEGGGNPWRLRADSNQSYFNWRTITGACKLYGSYDPIELVKWEDDKFQIYAKDPKQYVGRWSSKSNALYVRGNSTQRNFKFLALDEANLSIEDKLIIDFYKKSL